MNNTMTEKEMKKYISPSTEIVTTAAKLMDGPGGLISDSVYDGDGAAKQNTLANNVGEEDIDTDTEEVQPPLSFNIWED